MGSLLVIVLQPHPKDVVELSSTEANEVIQYFSLCNSNVAFTECVSLRGAWRSFDGSDFGIFPERVKGIRILSITVVNEESGFDTRHASPELTLNVYARSREPRLVELTEAVGRSVLNGDPTTLIQEASKTQLPILYKRKERPP